MKTTVEGSQDGGYMPTTPPDPDLLAAIAAGGIAPMRDSVLAGFHAMAQDHRLTAHMVPTSLGTKGQILLELAGIKAAIRTWYQKQPDEVVREASAYSARLTEMWTELRLIEPFDRSYLQVRTMQVQPVLDEIDRQMKFATSRIALMRQDIDMLRTGGGTP
jgi:hypothetical protein